MADQVIAASLSLDAEQASQSLGNIKKQLKEANMEVIEMSEKFGATSQQAIAAAKRAAELKDSIADSKALVDAFNPDQKFNAFASALGAVTGGFAALQGAMGLLGVESENVQKTLLKVQSALALSQGLNQVLDSIQSVKTFGSVLANTLGKSGVIGIAIAGVGALTAGILGLFDGTKKLSEAQKALKDTTKDYQSAAAGAIEKVSAVEVAFKQAKEGVISKKDALKVYNETLGDSLGKTNDLATAEKLLNDKAEAYIKATGLKAQANALFALSAQKAAEATVQQLSVDKAGLKEGDKVLGIDIGSVVKSQIGELQKGADEIKAEAEKLLSEAIQTETKFKVSVTPTKTAASSGGGGKAVDPRVAAEKAANAEIEKLQQENYLRSIDNEEQRQKETLRVAMEGEIKKINEQKISDELKYKLRKEVEEKYFADIADLEKKSEDERKKVRDDAAAKLIAAQQANDELLYQSKEKSLRKQIEAEYEASDKGIEAAQIRANKLAALNEQESKAKADKEYQEQVNEIARIESVENEKQKLLDAIAVKRAESTGKLNERLAEISRMKLGDAARKQLEDEAKIANEKEQARLTAREIEVNELLTTEEIKTQLLAEAAEARDIKLKEADDARKLAQQEAELGVRDELEQARLTEEELKLQQLDEWYKKRLAIVANNEELTAQLTEEYENRKTKVVELSNQQRLNAYAGALGAISNLIGRETAAGKVLAIAEATINTYLAASAVLKNAAKTPAGGIPGYAIAQMVSTIAAGLITVKNIVKTKVPNTGGGGGGSVSTAQLSTSDIPTPLRVSPQLQTTRLDQQSLSQMGNATVRAYVVESDVTNNQERIRRLNRAARLGG